MSTGVPENVSALIVAVLERRDGKRKGDEITFRAPCHDDEKPSASYNTAKGQFYCQACGKGGGWKKLAELLGVELPKQKRGRPSGSKKSERQIRAVYAYEDENGALLSEKVRYEPKSFAQRRPDGNGGHVYDLNGVRRILYRTPDLVASAAVGDIVFVVEGEKDVDTLRSHRLTATCNPEGAGVGKWRRQYSEQLRGRHVVVIPDADDAGRKHAAAVAAALFGIAASVAVLELPGVGMVNGADVTDWLGAGAVHTIEELKELAAHVTPLRRVSLADVRAVFRKHLVGDEDLIVAVLAVIAANRLPFDPVWIFFVGPPSSGKTERIMSVVSLPDVHLLSDLTVGGLLSGVAAKEHASGARGGLLMEIGAFGQIVILKDFGTILSMANDPRNALLAALREIFDGLFSRTFGSDGGRKATWKGKLGVIAGVTEAIDQYHAVVGQLGERFLYFRVEPIDRQKQARRSFEHLGQQSTMRRELEQIVTAFLATLNLDAWEIAWDEDDAERIANLADLASWLRSAVFRNGRNYEIELVPDAEAPARLTQQLGALFQGMLAIGAARPDAWCIVRKIALDCLPKLRRNTLKALIDADWIATPQVAVLVNVPTNTVRRTLEDLAAHGIVERDAARAKREDDQGDKRSDRWRLGDRARELFQAIAPTKSNPGNGKINTVESRESAFNISDYTSPQFVGAVADQVEEPDWSADDEVQEWEA